MHIQKYTWLFFLLFFGQRVFSGMCVYVFAGMVVNMGARVLYQALVIYLNLLSYVFKIS